MSLLPSRPDAEPAEDAGPRVIGVDDEAADDVLAALSSGTARSLLSALHDDPAPPSELAERCDTSLQNVQYHLEKLESAGAVEVVDTAYSAKGREMDVYAPADQPLVVFAGKEEDGSTLRTALRRLLGAVGVLALGSVLVQSVFGEGLLEAPQPAGGGGGGGGGGDGFGMGAPPEGDDGSATNLTAQGETDVATRTATERAEDATATAQPEATETAYDTPAATEAETETPMATATETVQGTATDLATTVPDGADGAVEGAAALPPGLLFFAGGLFVIGVLGAAWFLSRRWR